MKRRTFGARLLRGETVLTEQAITIARGGQGVVATAAGDAGRMAFVVVAPLRS